MGLLGKLFGASKGIKSLAAYTNKRPELIREMIDRIKVNDPERAAFAARAACDIVGDENVQDDADPELGAEDFSYMLEARPGAYLFLGQGTDAFCHHPAYDFNDEIAPIGASVFARLVEMAQPA